MSVSGQTPSMEQLISFMEKEPTQEAILRHAKREMRRMKQREKEERRERREEVFERMITSPRGKKVIAAATFCYALGIVFVISIFHIISVS